MPQIAAIASGVKSRDVLDELLEVLGVRLDVLPVVELLLDDDVCIMALSIATSRPGRNCSMWVAWRFSAWPRGSMTMSFAPRSAAFLKKVAATGWFSVGLAPMTTITSASSARHERRRHRARADRLRAAPATRRGVAEPRAVVDVVGAEAGRAPASGTGRPPRSSPWPSRSRRARRRRRGRGCARGRRPRASSASSQVASRKCVHGSAGIDRGRRASGRPSLRISGVGQPVRVVDVVEAEAALDAEPVLVRRARRGRRPQTMRSSLIW